MWEERLALVVKESKRQRGRPVQRVAMLIEHFEYAAGEDELSACTVL